MKPQYRIVFRSGLRIATKSTATRPWNRALRIMDRLRRSYGQTMVFVERAR